MTTFEPFRRDPVAVTNEPLATNRAHSRGRVALADNRLGWSAVHNRIEDENVGLNVVVSLPFRTNGRKTVLGGSFSFTFTGTHCL